MNTYVKNSSSISPKSPYPIRGDSCISQIALSKHAFPSIPNLNKNSSTTSYSIALKQFHLE